MKTIRKIKGNDGNVCVLCGRNVNINPSIHHRAVGDHKLGLSGKCPNEKSKKTRCRRRSALLHRIRDIEETSSPVCVTGHAVDVPCICKTTFSPAAKSPIKSAIFICCSCCCWTCFLSSSFFLNPFRQGKRKEEEVQTHTRTPVGSLMVFPCPSHTNVLREFKSCSQNDDQQAQILFNQHCEQRWRKPCL